MSDDSFERQSTPVAGLSDLLEKFSVRLAAACDMPCVLTYNELAREGAPLVMSAGRGYRCLNLGCPERSPVRASEPPTCYTCARPMAEVHAPVTQEEIAATLWRAPLRPTPVAARARPYGYDVADEPRPPARAIDGKFGAGDAVSVGYSADVGYCCTRPGCPQRPPTHAATAPTCYTCQQPMVAIAIPHGDGVGGALAFFTHNPSASAALPGHVLNGERCTPKWNYAHDLRWRDHVSQAGRELDRRVAASATDRWIFDGDCPEWGERYKPVGHLVTLDGEPITVLSGYYGEKSPRLIVPRADRLFWLGLAARKATHTIEWADYLAEFQVIEAVQASRGHFEIRFRRARPNLRPEEILPAIGPELAIARDVSKDPRERLAAAENLLMNLPSGPQFVELATELRSMRESAPLLDDPLVGPVQDDWKMIFPGVWQTTRASTVVGIDGRCVPVTLLEIRRNRSAASMTMRMNRSDAERLRGTRPTIETSSGTWKHMRVGGIVDTLIPGRMSTHLYGVAVDSEPTPYPADDDDDDELIRSLSEHAFRAGRDATEANKRITRTALPEVAVDDPRKQ